MLILVVSSFCQQNALLDRVKATYSGAAPLSVSFEVRIAWKVREKTETKRGSIVLAPGDRFRIELGSGVWVSDGTTLWQYDKILNQVVVKPLSSADEAMLPAHAIVRYCTDYSLVAGHATGPVETFEWKADSASARQGGQVSFVRLSADRKAAVIKRLLVIDRMGNESDYTFTKTVVGRPAPHGAFEFEPPKGARVLDQR